MAESVSEYDVSSYDYDLPREMIALTPAEPRDSSRLMTLDRRSGEIRHTLFNRIGDFLQAGDLLLLNNTKVFPARLIGTRTTTGRIEMLLLRECAEGRWEAMVGCHGHPRPGEFVTLEEGRLRVRLVEKLDGGRWVISLPKGIDLPRMLEEIGHVPLPPYIAKGRDPALEPLDRARYQTVFAREAGAVAAPTAGLHFTTELLASLERRGIRRAEITLHVGPGTFQPIKVNDIRRHKMHSEFFSMTPETAQAIELARREGRRIVAVGTTVCRTLETIWRKPETRGPLQGWTDIYLFPPYSFIMTGALVTNFHLPRSTLLALAAAFAGRERILAAYEEAKRQGYRFYSYGDAMIIL